MKWMMHLIVLATYILLVAYSLYICVFEAVVHIENSLYSSSMQYFWAQTALSYLYFTYIQRYYVYIDWRILA